MAAADAGKTMKAVQYDAYGAPADNLKLRDVAIPEPKANEVLLEMRASSINPVDWKISKGYLAKMMPFPFPQGFGADVSGVVIKVGADVKRFKVGDEVMGDGMIYNGGFAEFNCVGEANLTLKPKNISFVQAAAAPLVGLTSIQSIDKALGELKDVESPEGLKILIPGASGGVGWSAVQYAKYLKMHVVGVCSGKNVEYVKSLGADEVVNYREKDWGKEYAGKDFDIVYDCVGGNWANAAKVLRKGGVFMNLSTSQVPDDAEKLGIKFMFNFTRADSTVDIEKLAELLGSGAFAPPKTTEFSLANFQDCVQASVSGRAVGKLVIKL